MNSGISYSTGNMPTYGSLLTLITSPRPGGRSIGPIRGSVKEELRAPITGEDVWRLIFVRRSAPRDGHGYSVGRCRMVRQVGHMERT